MIKITEVFDKLGVSPDYFIPYGHHLAKIDTEKMGVDERQKPITKSGHLILVTAMSPTPQGEGKTTTTIGLGDALAKLSKKNHKKSLICLRQPAMGPCFGVKGGATGGGKAMLAPMDQINLNFTGDFHAIGAAHNLLSAMIDNHIHWGNELRIDARRVSWKRVIDLNDRALRSMVLSLGGPGNGFPREDGFDIKVASEVMAIFCLADNLQDLQERLGHIVIGFSLEKKPITAKDLKAHGAMAAILKTAIAPNLVQTLEGNPALVHGGPFANIAHGCNSVIATRTALKLADYVVTEAGFGADLGAEKFLNIKCRSAKIWPTCAVLVATVRGIQHHGHSLGGSLPEGMVNIRRHVENLKKFSLPVVVAINRFTKDTDSEIKFVQDYCQEHLGVKCAVNNSWAQGSEGSLELGHMVMELCDAAATESTASATPSPKTKPHYLYPDQMPLLDKIRTIAQKIYHAKDIEADPGILKKIEEFENLGFAKLPVCIAKTQYSFSTDPKVLGAASGHVVKVRDVRLSAGAGFVVAICGDIMTMPGLPRTPAAEAISVDSHGTIRGLF